MNKHLETWLEKWQDHLKAAKESARIAETILMNLGLEGDLRIGDLITYNEQKAEIIGIKLEPYLTLEFDKPIYILECYLLDKSGKRKKTSGKASRLYSVSITYIPSTDSDRQTVKKYEQH